MLGAGFSGDKKTADENSARRRRYSELRFLGTKKRRMKTPPFLPVVFTCQPPDEGGAGGSLRISALPETEGAFLTAPVLATG